MGYLNYPSLKSAIKLLSMGSAMREHKDNLSTIWAENPDSARTGRQFVADAILSPFFLVDANASSGGLMDYESLYIQKVSPMIELNELLLDELADTGKHGEAPFAIAAGMGTLMADIMDKVDPKRKR